MSHPCPGAIFLNTESLEIDVFLVDQFESLVHGQYLVDFPTSAEIRYSSSSARSSLDTPDNAMLLQSSTGAGAFQLSICGENNSTYSLHFTTTSNSTGSIAGTSCEMFLFGCPSGSAPETGKPCDYCKVKGLCAVLERSFTHHLSEVEHFSVTFVLLLVILALCLLLCLIVGTLAGLRYRYGRRARANEICPHLEIRRKLKYDRLAALEIPDFSQRPSLTLEEILNDKSIPHLKWEEVEIGSPIGKGASGLVSEGIWRSAYVVLFDSIVLNSF